MRDDKLVPAAWLFAAVAACAGCSSPDPKKPDHEPSGWADEIALPKVEDLNSDPNILEVNIEAKVASVEIIPGKPTQLWTYNGGLPGPLLRAKVGDRLIVHFKNSLPEPTTIHWHGLRIPNDQDGVPDMPYPAVAPGETFDYSFVLPDAGTYWYHPHVNSAEQLGDGLYGPIVVDDPNETKGLGDEAVLLLSDIGLDDNGVLEPWDGGGDFGTLFGREGNIMLVNGKVLPTLHVLTGARQRWRIINAAKARYFQLAMTDTTFTRIGGDGGMSESPISLDRVLVTPAQRADVIVEPKPAAGETAASLRWVAYDRGFGTAFNRPDEDVLRFSFEGEAAAPAPLPELHRDIPAIDMTSARPIDISLTLGTGDTGHLEMGINGVPSWKAEHIMTPLGEHQLWTVKNTFDFDHPFHMHGYFFQVLDVNGVAPAQQEWSDTVNVPVNAAVRFAIAFDDRPGMWMFHCHILDHADAGMMGVVHVQ